MFKSSVLLFMFAAVIITISTGSILAKKPTIVGGEPLIEINSTEGSGSKEIQLRNNTTNNISLSLHVSEFKVKVIDDVERKIAASAELKQPESNETKRLLVAELKPGESLFTLIKVSNFRESGEAYAYLMNGDSVIDIVRAVNFKVPFRVSVVAADPAHPEILLQRNNEGVLEFKNDDPMAYNMSWDLIIPSMSTTHSSQPMLIPGESTVPVNMTLPKNLFKGWFSGLFKDMEREGHLVMRFTPATEVAHGVLPTKTIPVKLKLRYWSSGWQSVAGGGIIILILLVGAFMSLLLNIWIPNKLKSMKLHRRIRGINRRTELITRNIDSALRVGARVDGLRLVQLIDSTTLFNTEAISIFQEYEKDIDLLERRVGIVKELEIVWDNLTDKRAKSEDAPPITLNEVGKKLNEAARLLRLSEPQESDFKEAQKLIREADSSLKNMTADKPEFAEKLAKNVANLVTIFEDKPGEIGSLPKFKEMRKKLEGLFYPIKDQKYCNSSNITPRHYHWLSSIIERLIQLRYYIVDYNDANGNIEGLTDADEEKFIKYLRSRSWNDLDRARRLRSEISERIFASDIEKALIEKNISPIWVPVLPRPNKTVILQAKFHNERLNTCNARDNFTCVWDFGRIGKEEGWQISHYFRKGHEDDFNDSSRKPGGPEPKTANGSKDKVAFKVTFRKPDGSKLESDKKEVVELVGSDFKLHSGDNEKWGKYKRIEVLRTSVAVLVAVLGLIAGAREQLMKLDVFTGLIGVFLLGFAVDSAKSLITRRSDD